MRTEFNFNIFHDDYSITSACVNIVTWDNKNSKLNFFTIDLAIGIEAKYATIEQIEKIVYRAFENLDVEICHIGISSLVLYDNGIDSKVVAVNIHRDFSIELGESDDKE